VLIVPVTSHSLPHWFHSVLYDFLWVPLDLIFSSFFWCFFSFLGGTLELNSGLHACKAGTLALEPHLYSLKLLFLIKVLIAIIFFIYALL
jgi:hypothetical protein